MNISLFIKNPNLQISSPRKLSVIGCFVALAYIGTTSNCFAQSSSDYHPGAGIKFHDLSGGSNSSSSSSPASGGTSTSSSSAAAVNSASSPDSSSGTSGDSASAGTESGEKGLGSFLKNVVRAGAQVGNIQKNNYGSGQSYSNYGSSTQSYSRPNASGYSSNEAMQSNYNAGRPNYSSSRPDLVQGGNPLPRRHSAFDGAQNQVSISGTPMELVTNNPPGPVDGDIENLIPKEIHTKAYGPELHRNGPLNGAEDNTHLF